MSKTEPFKSAAASNDEIIGNSTAVINLKKKIRKVAREDVTVLIIGESGTGKELVARAIHRLSQRDGGPFVPVNMGALEIVSSEIFGHEKGAFTGATDARDGLFKAADEGTLFLDEVGSMDYKTQTSLLRILENRVFRKLGGRKAYRTDARIIAANDTDLRPAVKEKRFRRDLMCRLEVFVIQVPPLCARPEDIGLLAEHFIKLFTAEMQRSGYARLTPEARECLLQYGWPGNVRELKNVIQSALLLAESDCITPQDLPPRITADMSQTEKPFIYPGMTLKEVEKNHIVQTLQLTKGNKSKAAKSLGVSRRYLYNKIEEYDIDTSSAG